MAGTPRPIGTANERVATTIRRIRREQELTTQALSWRLGQLGHQIAATGITKIEKGQRRVDVDDLVALAVALGVTPNTLLLPEVEIPFSRERRYQLTGNGAELRAEEIWAWALGERPLGQRPVNAASEDKAREAEGRFAAWNRRHQAPGIGAWIMAVERGARSDLRDRDYDAAMIAATVIQAFQWGRLSTADIRQAVESGFLSVLLGDPAEADAIMQQAWEWLHEVYERNQQEQQEEQDDGDT